MPWSETRITAVRSSIRSSTRPISWSVYWYNGLIVNSEIARGLDVFELTPSEYLSANEIAAANEPVPPLSVVRDRLYEILVGRKLNDEIERWVERALDEREVTRFVR